MATGSITITNHTPASIDIVTIQDNIVEEKDHTKTHRIDPKDTLVIFTDRVSTLHWEKTKQG